MLVNAASGLTSGTTSGTLGSIRQIAALVDDHAIPLDGPGEELRRHRIGRAADGQIDPFERLGTRAIRLCALSP